MRQEGCHNEDRVANVPDRISDEQVGMINRLYMDMGLNVDVLSCELEVNCVGSLQDKPNSVERAPSDIAKIQSKCVRTSYIVNGGTRKVRSMSDIVLSFLSPNERFLAEEKLWKKGRGRSQQNPLNSQAIANGSLLDSDFCNQKRIILREAQETLALGKLISAKTIGNEGVLLKI
ncbi:hypothetical protein V6N13_089354 [Hibiscus sabdariffa]